jgi:hypothetical protein
MTHPVNAIPERFRRDDGALKFWHDLCGPCTASFKAWQCAPNPGAWANPKIQDNPQLLAFLASCRVAGPSPQEWRETISAQLLLIRRICTDNKDGTHGDYVPFFKPARAVEDVPLPESGDGS